MNKNKQLLPLVSVIALSYKEKPMHLKACLESIFSQTYDNIELIITNDGANCFDEDFVNELINHNSNGNIHNVIVNKNNQNLGTVKNCNIALGLSSGAYIVFIACDDVYSNNNVIKDLVNGFDVVPSDTMAIVGQTAMYDEMLDKCFDLYVSKETQNLINTLCPNDFYSNHLILKPLLPAASIMYKREAFINYGYFDEKFSLIANWIYAIVSMKHGMRYYYLDIMCVNHRDGGVSKNKSNGFVNKMFQYDLLQLYKILLSDKSLSNDIYRKLEDHYENRRKHIYDIFEEPLVSVIVLSYNSEKYINSSFDSILAQTYQNVELILSDDMSTDSSISVAQAWMDKNGKRFVNCKTVSSDVNTGVVGTCNRGLASATGKYIKIIASDDIILPNYLLEMVDAMESKDADIAFCYEYVWYESDTKYINTEYMSLLEVRPSSTSFFDLSHDKQYERLLRSCSLPAPTAMISRAFAKKIGGFNEKYMSMEDYPFWLKAAQNNAKFIFVPCYEVLYRKTEGSVSWRNNKTLTSAQTKFQIDLQAFLDNEINPELKNLGYNERVLPKSLNEDSISDHKIKMEMKVAAFDGKGRLHRMIISMKSPLFFIKVLRRNYIRIKCMGKSAFLRLTLSTKEFLYNIRCQKYDVIRRYHHNYFHTVQRFNEDMYRAKSTYISEKLSLEQHIAQGYSSPRDAKKRKKVNKANLHKDIRKIRNTRKSCLSAERWMLKRDKKRIYGRVLYDTHKSICHSKLGILSTIMLLTSRHARHLIKKEKVDNELKSELSPKREEKLRKWMQTFSFSNLKIVENDYRSISNWKKELKKLRRQEKAYKNRGPSDKLTIVFAVHFFSSFSAIESIYQAMHKDSSFTPHIVLLPRYQPGMKHTKYGFDYAYDEGMELYMQERGYDYTLAYNDGIWVTLYDFNPDGVFFQTPYESQRPELYSHFCLMNYPKIMYTPYGPWIMDKSVSDYIDHGLNTDFFNSCWRVFMDKLSIEITQWAAPQYVEKCVLTGSPKVDYIMQGLNYTDYCWKNKDSAHKKVIWLPRWGIADDRTSFIDYYEYFIGLINQGNVEFVLRPHPMLWQDIDRTGVLTPEQKEHMISAFEDPVNSTIDYSSDYREGLLSCDFLIMDFTSIVYEYLPTGKPVIYTPKDNTLVDPRIMEACYIARNKSDLQSFIDMLMRNEDPLREKRLRIINELNYFPQGIPNGESIANYIAENIRRSK